MTLYISIGSSLYLYRPLGQGPRRKLIFANPGRISGKGSGQVSDDFHEPDGIQQRQRTPLFRNSQPHRLQSGGTFEGLCRQRLFTHGHCQHPNNRCVLCGQWATHLFDLSSVHPTRGCLCLRSCQGHDSETCHGVLSWIRHQSRLADQSRCPCSWNADPQKDPIQNFQPKMAR